MGPYIVELHSTTLFDMHVVAHATHAITQFLTCSIIICGSNDIYILYRMQYINTCSIIIMGLFCLYSFVTAMPSGWMFVMFSTLLRLTEGVGSAMFSTSVYAQLPELFPQSVGTMTVCIRNKLLQFACVSPECIELVKFIFIAQCILISNHDIIMLRMFSLHFKSPNK